MGKGPPDSGGIAAFLRTLLSSRLVNDYDVSFLNIAHAETPEGGKLTLGNAWRTIRDTSALWRAAKDQDVVHIHSAAAPGVTMMRTGRARTCGPVSGMSRPPARPRRSSPAVAHDPSPPDIRADCFCAGQHCDRRLGGWTRRARSLSAAAPCAADRQRRRRCGVRTEGGAARPSARLVRRAPDAAQRRR